MSTATLKAPFPYFGGKATVAADVWASLGDCAHYIEPFFGSGAVLLARPEHHKNQMETVCDLDGFVANVWRAIHFAPDEVAEWCDWPVNHADLSARKRKLIANEARLLENLIANDEWYDPKLAGYWIWAASCWIGSGLTSPGQRPHLSTGGMGVHALGQIPHLSDGGNGVHALGKRPHVGDGGKGVHALGRIPHVSDGGNGVHALGKRPHVGNGGMGDLSAPYNTNIYAWMRQLSERLRYVRVVCGDWTRVCGGNWQDNQGICGMFFDPPYSIEDRDTDIYHHDSTVVAHAVRSWCIERGSNRNYRIVLAGYEEHAELTQHGWTVKTWKAQGGYAHIGNAQGKANRHRECLYFSPHCLRERSLFSEDVC